MAPSIARPPITSRSGDGICTEPLLLAASMAQRLTIKARSGECGEPRSEPFVAELSRDLEQNAPHRLVGFEDPAGGEPNNGFRNQVAAAQQHAGSDSQGRAALAHGTVRARRRQADMKTATAICAALSIAYVNLVPYLCRLPRGVGWATQYLPEEGKLALGLLFFGAFASLPAIPLIVAFGQRRRLPSTLPVCLATVTVLLIYWHHDYDLASDAQAALGLIFIPIYALGLTTAVGAGSAAVELLVRRLRRSSPPRSS